VIATSSQAFTLQIPQSQHSNSSSNIDPTLQNLDYDTSSYTPSPIIPIARKRTRGSEKDDSQLRPNKIPKKGDSNIRALRIAIAIEESTRARTRQLQNALDLLFKVYTTQLLEEHLDLAIDLLNNKRKAAFFIKLPTRVVRNC
jgi:hypothetical protein